MIIIFSAGRFPSVILKKVPYAHVIRQAAHLGPTTSTYIPDYQLEWILMLHEYYMYYHDAELIKQVYPNLKKLLQYFEGYESAERGLVGKVPGWVVLDHPDTYKQDVDGENTAVNCLYYGALNSAAWMAR